MKIGMKENKKMENQKKKEYVKPQLTKIRLDAKCAVLGGCKISGGNGPNGTDCGAPLGCFGLVS